MIIAKILVFTVNFVLWASGILLIVFGGIALGSPSTIVNLLDLINGVSNITPLINVGSLLEGMAIFMIVLGSLLFLFGGVGCHGIHRMHKRVLMHYWLMLILGILTEIGVIIYGGVYPPTAQSSIQSQMYNQLVDNFQPVTIASNGSITYSTNDIANAWEALQAQTHCCGAYSPSDYQYLNWSLTYEPYPNATYPPTCCQSSNIKEGNLVTNISYIPNIVACVYNNGTVPYYYNQPCYKVAMDMLWNFNYIAMIIAGCLIAVQILGTIITVHTWHRMVRKDGF